MVAFRSTAHEYLSISCLLCTANVGSESLPPQVFLMPGDSDLIPDPRRSVDQPPGGGDPRPAAAMGLEVLIRRGMCGPPHPSCETAPQVWEDAENPPCVFAEPRVSYRMPKEETQGEADA